MPPPIGSAHLPEPGDPRALYVIDISGYLFRAYHMLPPLSTSKGEPTNAVLGATTMILKLVRERQPALIAVAMDARGSFRKDTFADYKATRREHPPDLVPQMLRVKEVIEAYAIPCFGVEGFEADDVIATLVEKAREQGLRTVIVSSDKDLLQLVTDDVVMYDTMRERVFDAKETVEKMGVPPSQVRDLLALTGDTSDNIPGVPSVGPKTAVQLLTEFHTIDGIYEGIERVTKKAIKQKLIDHKSDAYLSRDLVTLRTDVPIELDQAKVTYGGWDAGKLRALLTELEFVRLIDQIAVSGGPMPPAPVSERPKPNVTTRYRTILEVAELQQLAQDIRKTEQVAIFSALEDADPLRGDLVGIGLAWRADEAVYIPIAHRYLGVPKQLPLAVVLESLAPILTDASIAKHSDDLKRDEVAFARLGVRLRGGAFDTMLASYVLDPEKHGHDLESIARYELDLELLRYDAITEKARGKQKALSDSEVERGASYAAQRAAVVWVAREMFETRVEREQVSKLLHELEVPLAHVLAVVESTGVKIDTAHLASMSAVVSAEIRELEKKCFALVGREFNVGSPRQLESILFDELALPVVKRTKTGRSTDQEVLEELALSHDLPQAILEHRQLSKLKGTYIDALPKQIEPRTGRVHTRFNQAVAATGRISSSDPNLQNIPIRTELGRKIRDAFIAAEGMEILSADYSQIELRILAHLSEDPELVEAFQTGEDVHVRTATALFDVPKDKVTRDMRGQAKTVNFAVIYGQTQFALARNLKIERSEAARYIKAFFARYAGVARFMERLIGEASSTGAVRTVLGRKRNLPDIHSRNRALRQAAERVARNTPIQGSAADIMKLAMVAIARDMEAQSMKSKLLLTVHDELVLEVPPEERESIVAIVKSRMENAMQLRVPLVVDHGFGRTWGEAH